MKNFTPLIIDSNDKLYLNSILSLGSKTIGTISTSNGSEPEYISARPPGAYQGNYCWTTRFTCPKPSNKDHDPFRVSIPLILIHYCPWFY